MQNQFKNKTAFFIASIALAGISGCGKKVSKAPQSPQKSGVSQEASRSRPTLEFRVKGSQAPLRADQNQSQIRILERIEFENDLGGETLLVLKRRQPGGEIARVFAQFSQEPSRHEVEYHSDSEEFVFPAEKLARSELLSTRLLNAASKSGRMRGFEMSVEYANGRMENLSVEVPVLFPLKELRIEPIDRMSQLTVAIASPSLKRSANWVSERWTNASDEAIEIRFRPQSRVRVRTALAKEELAQNGECDAFIRTVKSHSVAHLDLAQVQVLPSGAVSAQRLWPDSEGSYSMRMQAGESAQVDYWLQARSDESCAFPAPEIVQLNHRNRNTGSCLGGLSERRGLPTVIVGFQFEGALEDQIEMKRVDQKAGVGGSYSQVHRTEVLTGMGEAASGSPAACQGIY